MAKVGVGIACASLSGILWSLSLWMVIGSAVRVEGGINFEDLIPWIAASLLVFPLVAFDWQRLGPGADMMYTSSSAGSAARILLFILILLMAGSIVGSMLLLVIKYGKSDKSNGIQFGIFQFLATIASTAAGLVWAFGRYKTRDKW